MEGPRQIPQPWPHNGTLCHVSEEFTGSCVVLCCRWREFGEFTLLEHVDAVCQCRRAAGRQWRCSAAAAAPSAPPRVARRLVRLAAQSATATAATATAPARLDTARHPASQRPPAAASAAAPPHRRVRVTSTQHAGCPCAGGGQQRRRGAAAAAQDLPSVPRATEQQLASDEHLSSIYLLKSWYSASSSILYVDLSVPPHPHNVCNLYTQSGAGIRSSS